ncbi:MAG: hypothetical protein QOK35_1722 [Pseudonocardiales bacterium]|jgi:hypothetical protein|nr:hypothetical protein [Pseudonocardiales bacterium]
MNLSMVDEGPGRVEGPSAVDAAVRFVAMQPGGAHRILLEHERRDDGTCAGCLTSPVSWPCVVGIIATKALELEGAH